MLHFAENHAAKPLFIVLSLFLILMTIVLTVAQTKESQDIRSSAASDIVDCQIDTEDGKFSIDYVGESNKAYKLINEFRKEKNLPPLKKQEDLQRAALWMSRDQFQQKKMSHKDTKNRNTLERISNCGYNYAEVVENVGEGTDSGKAIFEAWKASDEHRKNMLCKNCTEIGLADWNKYWTMTAGVQKTTPQTPPTETTAVEATATPKPTVTHSDNEASDSAELVDDQDETEEGVDEGVLDGLDDVTSTPATQTLPENTTGILLKIHLPGIGDSGNTDPLNPNRKVTVVVTSGTNEKIEDISATVSYIPETKLFTGAIPLPKIASSAGYLVNVKMPFSITKTISSGFIALQAGVMTSMPEISLPVINYAKGNTIGVSDYMEFRSCLLTNKCKKREMDVNDDGKIDLLDNNVIVEIFSTLEGE